MLLQQAPPPPGVDPNFLISQLIPLIGAVAAMVVGGVVLYAFFKSDLAKAFAERIRAGMHRRRHWKGLGAPRSSARNCTGSRCRSGSRRCAGAETVPSRRQA